MDFKKITLKNGLRIILVPEHTAKTAAVLVLVGTGSKYEQKSNNGISHFLEHMFFKGTKKRSTALKIAETLDRVGGAYNAFTSKEMTGYWAKTAKQHLPLALDWVADIFLNSLIESKEIEKEKGVIIEEINMYLDSPQRYVGELFEDVLYGDQPAGWDTIGTKANIARFQRSDFLGYFKNHYCAKNTVVCVAGNFSTKTILSKIEKQFQAVATIQPPEKLKVKEKQDKPGVIIKTKKTDQTHLCLGFRGFGLASEQKYAQQVLSVILGGNMSSRMFSQIREKNGLAYYISTTSDAYTDSGYIVTQAGVPNNQTAKAIELIIKEYKKMVQETVSSQELKKAKDYIKGSLTIGLESPDALASFLATQEVLEKKILTLEQICVKINKVSAKEIQAIARELFVNKNMNMALIGPHNKDLKINFKI